MPIVIAAVLIVVIIILFMGVNVVPQQHAYVVERLGRFHGVLQPGLRVIIPFVDRIRYRHLLKDCLLYTSQASP